MTATKVHIVNAGPGAVRVELITLYGDEMVHKQVANLAVGGHTEHAVFPRQSIAIIEIPKDVN